MRTLWGCGLTPSLPRSYVPPLLWGKNGHAQTILFSMIGRFSVPEISGKRQWLRVEDGSTVSYDIFEPSGESRVTHTILVCPGEWNGRQVMWAGEPQGRSDTVTSFLLIQHFFY